jgi:hypothetical protein
LKDGETLEV